MWNILLKIVFVLAINKCYAQENLDEICKGIADDTLVEFPGDCSQYYYCYEEIAYPGQCDDGLFVDFGTNNCVESEFSDCLYPQYPDPDPDPDPETDPDPEPSLEPEIDPDPETEPSEVITEGTTPPTTPPPSDETPVCPKNNPDEVFFFQNVNCNKYYMCINGNLREMTCAGNLHWNQDAKSCDFPENANCKGTTDSPETCPRQGETLIPHRTNCDQFIFCFMGLELVQNCPFNYRFDFRSRVCVFRDSAQCAPWQN